MISKLILVLFAFSLIFTGDDAEARKRRRKRKPTWRTKVEGEFQPQLRYYSSDENENTEDAYSDFLTNFKLKAKKRRHRIKLNLVARAVSEDSASSQFYVKEAWYSYRKKPYEILVGANYFTWSNLEVFHPIEVLNATEFIDREKIGELMLSFKWNLDEKSIQFYYIPLNTGNIYPSARSRGMGLNLGSPYWVEENNKLLAGRLAHNFAIEWKQSKDSFDYRLLVFNGPDRALELFSFDGSQFHPTFFRSMMLGGNLQGSWFGSTWKFELLNKSFGDEYGALIPKSHSVMALGWEYPYTLRSGGDISFLIEVQKAFGASVSELESYYTFQSDLFLGARYNLSDIAGTEMTFGILHDLARSGEDALSFEFSRRLNSKWKLELGAQVRLAKQKEAIALGLERLDGQNYVYSKLFYYFR